MSRIVITGASGQYGRSLTDKLIALGRATDLILITRRPDKLAGRASQGCTVRYGDYRFPEPDEQDAHAEGIGLTYPGKIVLCSHDGIHRLEMSVEEVNINTEIDATKYTLPKPENVKSLDLGAALKRAGNLWD